MRPASLILLLSSLALAAPGALAATLSGRVVDRAGRGIVAASVSVVELRRGAVADTAGRWTLAGVPFGTYHLSFQRLGYAPEVRHLTFDADTPPLEIVLRESLVEIPGTQVTATPHATSALASPQPTTVLEGEALAAARQATLGATLASMPGLRSFSTGGGIGKPVIRGLRSDRVLVVADGQRLEHQAWGDEHGPQVESGMIDRVEVIRGPASVLYGSDALGGVVNVIAPDLPVAIGSPAFVRGRAGGGYGANDDAVEGDGTIEGAVGGFGWRAAVSSRDAGDARTPGGRLANSGSRATTGAASAGVRGAWGSIDGGFAHRDERIEIHEDPAEDPAATPFQRIGDTRGHLRWLKPTGADQRLELRLGLEHNHRREYEASSDAEAAVGLLARTASSDARWVHPAWGALEGVVGVSFRHERFTRAGEESLIPTSRGWDVGAYVFEQIERGRWHGSFGVRADRRRLDVSSDAALGVAAETREWDAVSGNVGVSYAWGGTAAVVANVGRGFRAPSSFDLYSNGVHEGTVSYEIGDPTLDVERSLAADVGVRLQGASARAELSGFVNDVHDYIHSRPTGEVDSASGFPVFRMVQGDARLAGFEASGEWHVGRHWHVTGSLEHVVGDNRSTGTPLPWIPPLRAQLGARWEPAAAGAWSGHAGVRGEHVAEPTRLDPLDVGTAAVTLLHAEAGVRLARGHGHVRLSLQGRNLLDTRYRDFMSRFKAYADAPGRAVTARLDVAF